MQFSLSTLKHALKAGAVVATLMLGTSIMRADAITFSGNASGTFGNGTSTLKNTLTYNGASFSQTTSNSGYASIGGATLNFGSFSLGPATTTFSNNPFTLDLNFIMPGGITGGQMSSYKAHVDGSVTMGDGGATVNFGNAINNNGILFTFNDGNESGSFRLYLNDVSVSPDHTAPITGHIQADATAVTPEPNSLMLLGTGFVSAAGMLMRRRKALSL